MKEGVAYKLWKNIDKTTKENIYNIAGKIINYNPIGYTISSRDIPAQAEEMLVSYFRSDIEKLSREFNINVPWSRYR
jgi:hypothetical protein